MENLAFHPGDAQASVASARYAGSDKMIDQNTIVTGAFTAFGIRLNRG
jgi:hypothetical protein